MRRNFGAVPPIVVRAKPGEPRRGLLAFDGTVFPCALGRGAIATLKREGDGATPRAAMRPVAIYFRRDAGMPPRARLPLRAITARDGWCDAPGDRNYNRAVRLPYPGGHERMRRDDHLYDVCVVLDWNRVPRRRGAGSAIFLHLARPGFAPTEGCIAVTRPVMARLLPHLTHRSRIRIAV